MSYVKVRQLPLAYVQKLDAIAKEKKQSREALLREILTTYVDEMDYLKALKEIKDTYFKETNEVLEKNNQLLEQLIEMNESMADDGY